MSRLFLLLLLPLAACATPRQACDRAATQDLRVIDALIVETTQNITRGYALEREVVEIPNVQFCYGRRVGRKRGEVGMVLCNDTRTQVRERPVAIDIAAEEKKLASLKAKRPEVAQRASLALAACALQYPAGEDTARTETSG